jgi:hypothetical protein
MAALSTDLWVLYIVAYCNDQSNVNHTVYCFRYVTFWDTKSDINFTDIVDNIDVTDRQGPKPLSKTVSKASLTFFFCHQHFFCDRKCYAIFYVICRGRTGCLKLCTEALSLFVHSLLPQTICRNVVPTSCEDSLVLHLQPYLEIELILVQAFTEKLTPMYFVRLRLCKMNQSIIHYVKQYL